MAPNVPLDVNSNFVFMVECCRSTLDGQKWHGKGFFSQDSVFVGSSKTLIHVSDTVQTSNLGQTLCLMAYNFPLHMDSNFVFMVKPSLTPLNGQKRQGKAFSPKLRGSEIWFRHVPDTVLTSNVDRFSSLMAQNVPWHVNSNFAFMVECSRSTLDGRKWPGKKFCPETLGLAKWGS